MGKKKSTGYNSIPQTREEAEKEVNELVNRCETEPDEDHSIRDRLDFLLFHSGFFRLIGIGEPIPEEYEEEFEEEFEEEENEIDEYEGDEAFLAGLGFSSMDEYINDGWD